jgi:hypothetical protein
VEGKIGSRKKREVENPGRGQIKAQVWAPTIRNDHTKHVQTHTFGVPESFG